MHVLVGLHLEANHVLLAGFDAAVHLFCTHRERVAHLHTGGGVVLEVGDFLTFGFQLFGGVEGDVGLAALQKLVHVLMINLAALALAIGTVRSFGGDADTFVNVDA